jgi:hypothetical protein
VLAFGTFRNSRYGVNPATWSWLVVRMRLRKAIFVPVIFMGSSSLPMCGKRPGGTITKTLIFH